jgi:hypothetical protein
MWTVMFELSSSLMLKASMAGRTVSSSGRSGRGMGSARYCYPGVGAVATVQRFSPTIQAAPPATISTRDF